jgi:uncharacterized membrane protein YhaH (DUF805 family)
LHRCDNAALKLEVVRMGFSQAVRVCLTHYATFEGRARRPEYWYFTLFCALAGIVTSLADAVLFPGFEYGFLGFIYGLALFLPSIAVGVRRLHDIGRSGWWMLLALLPVLGMIILLIWSCRRSDADNRFGPSHDGMRVR